MARRKKVDIICYKNGTAPYIDTLLGDYIQKKLLVVVYINCIQIYMHKL